MLVSPFPFVIIIKGIKRIKRISRFNRFKRFKRFKGFKREVKPVKVGAKPQSSPQGLGLNGPLGPFKPSIYI